MADGQSEEDLQRGLLRADHSREDLAPIPENAATHDAEISAAGISGRTGGLAQPDPRSPLSREASMTDLVTPASTRRNKITGCKGLSTWFTVTLLLGVVAVVGVICVAFAPPIEGATPAPRKSAAIAVRQGPNGSQSLAVWSGMGHGEVLYHDLHTFSLARLTWTKEKDRKGGNDIVQAGEWQPERRLSLQQRLWQSRPGPPPPPPPPPRLPDGRWKAAVVQVEGLGMVVHGGDVPKEGGKGQLYKSDTWLLTLPGLRWQQGTYNSSGDGSGSGKPSPGATAPCARRAHSLVSYQDAEGRQALLLFAGRRHDGMLLNDVWRGAAATDAAGGFTVSWTLLHDPQRGVGTGPAPLPRKGHVAVMHNNSHMLVHGGRSEVYGYFTDVWLFDVARREWQPLPPATSVQPVGRDHHGGAMAGERLFIFGGRAGPTYGASRPVGDRWLFDLSTRTWRSLPIRGLSPLPRFLFSSLQYAPAGGGADQFLVFGGETGFQCKLNDVWLLDLETLRWTQLASPFYANRRCKQAFGS